MAEVKTLPSAGGTGGTVNTKNRDAVASGIFELLKPAVDEIDDRVKTVRLDIFHPISSPHTPLNGGRVGTFLSRDLTR